MIGRATIAFAAAILSSVAATAQGYGPGPSPSPSSSSYPSAPVSPAQTVAGFTGGDQTLRSGAPAAVTYRDRTDVAEAGRGMRCQTLGDQTTITPDLAEASCFRVVLGGARTLANPSYLPNAAQRVTFVFVSGGNFAITYGSKYKDFPVLSTTAGYIDVVSAVYEPASGFIVDVADRLGVH